VAQRRLARAQQRQEQLAARQAMLTEALAHPLPADPQALPYEEGAREDAASPRTAPLLEPLLPSFLSSLLRLTPSAFGRRSLRGSGRSCGRCCAPRSWCTCCSARSCAAAAAAVDAVCATGPFGAWGEGFSHCVERNDGNNPRAPLCRARRAPAAPQLPRGELVYTVLNCSTHDVEDGTSSVGWTSPLHGRHPKRDFLRLERSRLCV
jgi:hypothetical protein